MAKEYLMIHGGDDKFPLCTEITDYQDTVLDESKQKKHIEIDLLGKNGREIVLVGECKFKNAAFDKAEFEKLLDKVKYLPVRNPLICIFSLGGFSDYVRKNAGGCRLIDTDEMYK